MRFTLDQTGQVVEALIRMNDGVLPCMARRDHVAWVMNVLATIMGEAVVSADADGGFLPALPAKDVLVTAELTPQKYLGFDVSLPSLPLMRTSPPAAAIALARLFAPSVYALAYAGPIAPRALWRIVGDGLAWGWTRQDDVERGREILATHGAPFANPQLSFRRGAVDRRGGCCRYLSVDGTACGNCPLRK